MKMKKGMIILFSISAVPMFGSCGQGVDGYHAGSTFKITMPADTSQVLPTGTMDFIYKITVLNADGFPQSGVQLSLNCERCSFLDNPGGPRWPESPDFSTYTSQGSDYIVKTGDTGTYTLLVQVQGVLDLGFENTYSAGVTAVSGAVFGQGKITLSAK